jgi:hypothetical protein
MSKPWSDRDRPQTFLSEIASVLGFFSAVRNNEIEGDVLVRARCRADIFNLFLAFKDKYPMTLPQADEARDYRWRLSMKRADWALVVAELAAGIDYANFQERRSQAARPGEQEQRVSIDLERDAAGADGRGSGRAAGNARTVFRLAARLVRAGA